MLDQGYVRDIRNAVLVDVTGKKMKFVEGDDFRGMHLNQSSIGNINLAVVVDITQI